ncbi:MAG: class I SAM-dependent methyltransferase [Nitrosopumilus sp.]|nr:class I SAM-dependent methyltransferase [Nitrosopumilus sp.]NRA06010.1 class I SAM-dependent methyltransferase [Nitrosopumilus sp.]
MGLGSYWGEVMDVLREIIPIYDKVNSIISLGKDVEHRKRGISKRVFPGNKILDAGSGFGNMSKTAMELTDGKITITLFDPLVPMLKNTSTYFENSPDMANGVFEHIPFRNEEFDAVLCGYSLRDAINLRIAISEIHRVLKKDGRFVIVDLGKPDELFFRIGVSFYLRCILPILAFIAGGKLGLKFGKLYGTYKRWPQNKKLEGLLLEKFSKVEFEKDLMGGAIMIAAYK